MVEYEFDYDLEKEYNFYMKIDAGEIENRVLLSMINGAFNITLSLYLQRMLSEESQDL